MAKHNTVAMVSLIVAKYNTVAIGDSLTVAKNSTVAMVTV